MFSQRPNATNPKSFAGSLALALPLSFALIACDSDRPSDDGATGGGVIPPAPNQDTGAEDMSEGSASAGQGENDNSSDDSNTSDDGGAGKSSSNTSDADSGVDSQNNQDDSSGDQSSAGGPSDNPGDEDSNDEEDADSEAPEGVRFDVSFPDGGELPKGTSTIKHSYIWIANSSQGSISKIETQSLVEKGRYLTAPAANNPSRTSVDLNGNAGVAGRGGGVTKIYADPKDCEDKDGSGEIETSIDATSLAWGTEECVAWHTPTAYTGHRGVAWTQGEYDPERDEYTGQNLWVSSLHTNPATSLVEAVLYNGDDGSVLGVAELNEASKLPGVTSIGSGAYGGAVDTAGNFWFTPGSSYLARANPETFKVIAYPMSHSGYGMTVGGHGYVWTCGTTIGRFDPKTETWTTAGGNLGRPDLISSSYSIGGCMVDAEGVLWHSATQAGGSNGIVGIDVETMTAVNAVALPEHTHGISIDFYGYVWGISFASTKAYRVDPVARDYEVFTDLVGAYTYSDMTGFALSSTVGPGVG